MLRSIILIIAVLFLLGMPSVTDAQPSIVVSHTNQDVSCTVGQMLRIAGRAIFGIEAIGTSNVDVRSIRIGRLVRREITKIVRTSGTDRTRALGVSINNLNVSATKSNNRTVLHHFTGSTEYSIGGAIGLSFGSDPFSDQCNAYI